MLKNNSRESGEDGKALSFIRSQYRRWITILTIAIFAGLITGGILLHTPKPHSTRKLPLIGHAYNFSLVNSNGQPVSLSDSTGKVRLIAFIYTRCTTVCPIVTSQMVQLQSSLAQQRMLGKQVELISITIDPSYDTESVLQRYKKEFKVSPIGWEFLTGSKLSIDQTLKKYGIYAAKLSASQYVHSVDEFLIDGKGNIRKEYGMDLLASGAENDIVNLVHSEG